MSAMDPQNALVIRTGGTNCDLETVEALRRADAQVELLHLNSLARDPKPLNDAQIVVLAGGFSYGDYVAAGRLFGLELRLRLEDPLRRFVERGGLLLGVCNGFQVLVEIGFFLPPGTPAHQRPFALTENASNRFECRWVTLATEETVCPFVTPGERMPVPVAHAEGRFVVRDPETLAALEAGGQIVWRYAPSDGAGGSRGSEVAYPENPNGSMGDIAGICDPTGRVVGLMPHPERNLDPWNHPCWTRRPEREEGEGLSFYRNLVRVAAGLPLTPTTTSTPRALGTP